MVSTKRFKNEEEALKEMKHNLERVWNNPGTEPRPWLEASPPDSYESPSWRVTVFVLMGSPPKGIILLNHSHHLMRGFDGCFKEKYRYYWGDS
jgi:hypothetical protein